VSTEPELRKEFRGSDVETVEFEFGEPAEVDEMPNGGYVYTYYVEGYAQDGRNSAFYRRRDDSYIEFLFDRNGLVKSVQSDQLLKQSKFDAGRTVGGIVFFTVIIPACVIAAVILAR
jgi:hypothetical protein